MQNITEIITTTVVFTAFAIVIIAILNFIVKMRIINAGYKDEAWIKTLSGSKEYKYSSLKWAILLFFGGISLVIISVIPIPDPAESPLTYGVLSISLSAGFLVYYLLVGRKLSE
jgi:hypothetical protein